MTDFSALRAAIEAVGVHKQGCRAAAEGGKQYDYDCPYCSAIKNYVQAKADDAAASARDEHFG